MTVDIGSKYNFSWMTFPFLYLSLLQKDSKNTQGYINNSNSQFPSSNSEAVRIFMENHYRNANFAHFLFSLLGQIWQCLLDFFLQHGQKFV